MDSLFLSLLFRALFHILIPAELMVSDDCLYLLRFFSLRVKSPFKTRLYISIGILFLVNLFLSYVFTFITQPHISVVPLQPALLLHVMNNNTTHFCYFTAQCLF